MKNKIIALFILIFALVSLDLFLFKGKKNHYVAPVVTKKNIDKSAPAYTACVDSLTTTFNKIKTDSTVVSELALDCKNQKGECKELGDKARNLVSYLGNEDMNLRWQDFSCSPLLFVKIKQLSKSAEALEFLSRLKHKGKDLENQSRALIEPLRFYDSDHAKIEESCCPRA